MPKPDMEVEVVIDCSDDEFLERMATLLLALADARIAEGVQ